MDTETWNRLTIGEPVDTADGKMGGRIWDGTVARLREHGHRAFAPTLADEYTATLTGHIGEVRRLITEHTLQNVVLVGHSYGGMITTGVAAALPERIGRLVYVDAALPDSGQSLFDIIAGAGIRPAAVSGLDPAPPYVEPLFFDPAVLRPLQKTYIRCTKSDFVQVTAGAREKIAADRTRWTYHELPASHVPMADMPEELFRILLEAAGEHESPS